MLQSIFIALFRIAEQNDNNIASKDHDEDCAAQEDGFTHVAIDRV